MEAPPLIPGEFFTVVRLTDGVPQISLGHVLRDQHEGAVLLTHSQEQDNVVVPQAPQQFDLPLEVLYLLAGLLAQHLNCHRLAAKSVGLVDLQPHGKKVSCEMFKICPSIALSRSRRR